VSTANSSPVFKKLANFLVQIYVPVWFANETKTIVDDESTHMLHLVQLSRQLTEDVKAAFDPVIQRNAYFAHPENLLLEVIADE
jgi:glutathionyl-hydroquinone reductase